MPTPWLAANPPHTLPPSCHPVCCLLQELETQLKNTSEERTQYESKFHELSIKHRQLIETSPQVATLWQEVVGASSAAQAGQHEVDRLTKFDLRHTGKGPGGEQQPPV
jgi:hypothetical protein